MKSSHRPTPETPTPLVRSPLVDPELTSAQLQQICRQLKARRRLNSSLLNLHRRERPEFGYDS